MTRALQLLLLFSLCDSARVQAQPPLPPAPANHFAPVRPVTRAVTRANIAPVAPPNFTTNIETSWDAEMSADGYASYWGNSTGNYILRIDDGSTNDVTVNLDTRQPWFGTVTSYWQIPQVIPHSWTNRDTGAVSNWFTTNAVTESGFSDEVFFMPPYAQPFCQITNGVHIVWLFASSASNYTADTFETVLDALAGIPVTSVSFTGTDAGTPFILPLTNQYFLGIMQQPDQ